jgi:hypothetical protein
VITAGSTLIASGAMLLFYGLVFKGLTYRGSTANPPTPLQQFSQGRVNAARRYAPILRRVGFVCCGFGVAILCAGLITAT